MNRPVAIQRFEQIYLVSILLEVLAVVLGWSGYIQASIVQLEASNIPPERAASLAGSIVGGVLIFTILVRVLLWFLAARRASVIAKWLVTLGAAYALLAMAYNYMQGVTPGGVAGALNWADAILAVIAVWFLFRSEAAPWFASDEPAA